MIRSCSCPSSIRKISTPTRKVMAQFIESGEGACGSIA